MVDQNPPSTAAAKGKEQKADEKLNPGHDTAGTGGAGARPVTRTQSEDVAFAEAKVQAGTQREPDHAPESDQPGGPDRQPPEPSVPQALRPSASTRTGILS